MRQNTKENNRVRLHRCDANAKNKRVAKIKDGMIASGIIARSCGCKRKDLEEVK